MEKILIKNSDFENNLRTLEFARYIGFNTENSSFPICSYSSGLPVPKNHIDFKKFFRENNHDIPEGFISSTKLAEEIPELGANNDSLLESLFSLGPILKDLNHDMLADNLNLKFNLPKKCSDSVFFSAVNLAFRYGMELTEYKGSILADEDYSGNLLLFTGEGKAGLECEKENGSLIIKLNGDGDELNKFVSYLCENFPYFSYSFSAKQALEHIKNSFCSKNLDGQLTFAKSLKNKHEISKILAEKSVISKKNKLKTAFTGINLDSYKSDDLIYTKNYEIDWELNTINNIFNDELLPKIKSYYANENLNTSRKKIYLRAAVSEGLVERTQIKKHFEAELKKINIDAEINVLCAYKQGFSWIEDELLHKLSSISAIDKIIIKFAPFLQDKHADWHDENGATPSYTNVGGENENKWYDLPIRLLQELYPIDDLLADKLQIDRNNIVFEVYNGEDDISYEFSAYSKNTLVFSDTYKAEFSERNYLDEYSGMGKVHPSTAYISVSSCKENIFFRKFNTDLENIWDIYQGKILPDVKNFIFKNISPNPSYNLQPFFSKLEMNFSISEPERILPYRQDIISSLNAFHEDLYFVGTDYFKNLAHSLGEKPFDCPGLILPNLKVKSGSPEVSVSLYGMKNKKPCVIDENNKYYYNEIEKDKIELKIDKIKLIQEKFSIRVKTYGVTSEMLEAYCYLLSNGYLDISERLNNVSEIDFILCNGDKSKPDNGNAKTCEENFKAIMPKHEVIKKDLKIEDIFMPDNELIGYEQYIAIMDKLKSVKNVEVYLAGESYQGRKIYAVDFVPENVKGYISRTKRNTFYPSQLINCRHHANEVSSSNAAFNIIKNLLTQSEFDKLYEKINLSIIPVENVDGTAIHYELQKENPHWSFHTARFNSLGKEFFSDILNSESIHTEAHAFKNVYETLLPDLIVDNHGVPKHEWDQQFSGYTSPSFKGFWLPRSILYAYFWQVKEPEFKQNHDLCDKLQDEVVNAINSNKIMYNMNKDMGNRFEKYAHSWLPNLFPANYYKDMIIYKIVREKGNHQSYFSYRHPWICTCFFTSETADETATNDYLSLCSKTHETHNLAIIKLMLKGKSVIEIKNDFTPDNIHISSIRQRPYLID